MRRARASCGAGATSRSTAAPKYFMMYETETLETLASPAYVERLEQSDAVDTEVPRALQELEPHGMPDDAVHRTRHRRRDGHHPSGSVSAGASRRSAGGSRMRRCPSSSSGPASRPRISARPTWRRPRSRRRRRTIRDKPDEVARWVLLVEGSDADIVGRACRGGARREGARVPWRGARIHRRRLRSAPRL